MSVIHADRRNLGTPETRTRVSDTAIVQTTIDGEPYREMAFAQVREVRLAVEMAAQASQVVCRVKDASGQELAFGSMRFKAPGVFESEIETFQPLLQGLHGALLPFRDQIRFLEGQSMAFMIIMFGLGIALAVIGVVFFIVLAVLQENPAGFFLIAAMAAGIWMMRLFWPRGPKTYDPGRFARPDEAA